MALFGKSKQLEVTDVEFDVRTSNSWFVRGVPRFIIRDVVSVREKSHKTLEKVVNQGVGYVNPVINVALCSRLVEYDDVLEVVNGSGVFLVPKCKIVEIRY